VSDATPKPVHRNAASPASFLHALDIYPFRLASVACAALGAHCVFVGGPAPLLRARLQRTQTEAHRGEQRRIVSDRERHRDRVASLRPWPRVDLNHDGLSDLAVANSDSNTLSVLIAKASGGFADPVDRAVGLSPNWVTCADLDGDGSPDVVTVSPVSGSVSVLLGSASGSLRAAKDYSAGSRATAVTPIDLDGDGKLDLAVPNRDVGTLSVLVGKGDGSFKAATRHTVCKTPTSVAAGDFNGDGRNDLAVTCQGDGVVQVLLNRCPK